MDQLTRSLPAALRARPPADGDAAAITAMYLRADEADLGRPDTDEDDVTAVWRWPSLDRDRDAVVVTGDGGELVGYAWVHLGREGDVTVDPAWRGRGVGGALLDWTVRRATEQAGAAAPADATPADAAEGLGLYALSTIPAAARLLQRAGFVQDRVSLLLRIEVDAPPEPAWPAGVTLRPAFDRERDGRELHRLITTAMADVEGTVARPFEEWEQFALRRAAFDPTLVFVAEAGGEPVGATLNFEFAGEGYVQYLAVARPWRRRGLGLALLLHTFAAFAKRGVTGIELNADAANSTGATKLYERAGMREVHRWNRWYRRHRPG